MTERDLFIAALRQPGPAERAAFLDETTAGDAGLRERVEAMLAEHDRLGSFLELPAAVLSAASANGSTATFAPVVEAPGAVIGPYKLVEVIGEGGMGTVYLAQQQTPVRRLVALKVIKSGMDSRQVLARFEAERQALALMDHPNIAKVFDGGIVAPEGRTSVGVGRPFFVMELVKGVPITEYCDVRRLSPRERLELFVPVCHAVQHAHQKGVIHRDLKPTNVLVALYDGRPVPKVIDFGVAKAAGPSLTDMTLVTGFGAIVGTLEYMSPEQAQFNQLDIDTRSDIYSLGVLLYELLAGSTPLDRKRVQESGMLEALRIIREDDVPTLSNRLSTTDQLPAIAANRGLEPAKLTKLVRGELDWIVRKALEKDRGRRYETANGFAMDVQRYLANEPVQACPPSTAYRLRKFVRRHRTSVMAASLVALALVTGLIGTTVGLVRADHHWRRAETAVEEEREAKNREAEKHRLAEERKKLADASARQAVEEKRVAAAVRDFLQTKLLIQADVLTQAEALLHGGGLAAHSNRDIRVRELVDRAAAELSPEKIQTNFPNQPLVQTELLTTIGATYHGVGEVRKAVEFLERAAALAQHHLGGGEARTLMTQQRLAVAYGEAGNLQESIRLHREVSGQLEQQFGSNNLDTILAYHNLAAAYVQAGRADEAIHWLVRAVAAFEKEFGPPDERTLTARHNIAQAHRQAGRLKEAHEFHEQVYHAMEEHLGPDHPRTHSALGGLARSYRDVGKFKESIRLMDRTHKARSHRIGPNHPNTLITLSGLATAYLDSGDLKESIRLFGQARDAQQKQLGADHPDTLRTVNGLAIAYHHVGKLREAIQLFETARDGLEKQLGPDHPDTLSTLNNLAAAYQDDGKLEEAFRLFERVRDARTRLLGPDHPSTLTTLTFLGGAHLYAGRVPEAIQLLERARAAREKQFDAEHPDVLTTLHDLARAYLDAKKVPQAIELYEQVRDARVRRLGPDHPNTLATLGDLVLAYWAANRLPEAVALAERVRDSEEKQFGLDHPRTLTSINNLALVYWHSGKRPEAIRFFEQAREGREKKLGRDHPKTLATLNSLAVAYWTMKRLDKSIPLFEDLLKRQELKLTRNHPDTLATITNLGVNYRDADRFDQGIPLLEEAYREAKTRSSASWAGNELWVAYVRAGKSAEAIKLIEKELSAVRGELPPESPQLAAALAKSANRLMEVKAYAVAEPILRESLAIYQTHPSELPRMAALALLGGSLLGQEKYADAEPMLVQAYEGFKRLEENSVKAVRIPLTDVVEQLIRLYEATGNKAQMAKWKTELETRKKTAGNKKPVDSKSK